MLKTVTCAFEKLIKIRIGEPLTALSLNQNCIFFGSISGYLGMYFYQTGEIRYLYQVFDELIRDITLYEDNKAYVCIGDLQGLIFNDITNVDSRHPSYEIFDYSQRQHQPAMCSGSLTMISQNRAILTTMAPNQNKLLGFVISRIFIQYLFSKKRNLLEKQIHFQLILIIQKCIIWEYCLLVRFVCLLILMDQDFSPKNRNLIVYDIEKRKNEQQRLQKEEEEKKQEENKQEEKKLEEQKEEPKVDNNYIFQCNFTQKSEFISFCRLYKNFIIYVENNTQVTALDINTNKIELLYKHKDSVIALTIRESYSKYVNDSEQEKIQMHTDSLEEIAIITVDFSNNLTIYSQRSIYFQTNLLKINGAPQCAISTKYLFDMGYPYYVKANQNHVAITTDIGLYIIKLF